MRELSLIMPEGSWLQSTDASLAGDPALAAQTAQAGTTATQTAAPAAPSANLVGCTPRQSDVARMMVRLRQLHRVEDVSLNESSQEAQGAAGHRRQLRFTFYKFDLTVTFGLQAPAGETPRGATRVPASLGGGS